LSKETLIELLQSETLDIDEIEIFKAVVRWIDSNIGPTIQLNSSQNKKEVLETILPLIQCVRFALIPPNDLIRVVKPTKLVPKELYIQVLEYHLQPNLIDVSSAMFKPRVPVPMFHWQGNSKEFDFSEAGLRAERIGSSYWTKVFGSVGFSSGKAFWEVKITAISEKDRSGLIIGVTNNKARSSYFNDYGIGMAGHCYHLNSDVKQPTYIGFSANCADKIGVQLDLVNMKASFFVNGIALSVEGNLEKGTYFPVVHVHYVGDAVTLVKVK